MNADYRESHQGKGQDYDRALCLDPFSAYMAEREAEILRHLAHKHFRGTIPRYLDFACGTGRITRLMEEFAIASYAIDVSSTMVATAQKKCRKTVFAVVDITKSRVKLPQMDLITTFRFFGNAQDELRIAALKALHTMLEPHGFLIFNNHRNPAAPVNALSRLTGATEPLDLYPSKMRRLLTENGFRIVRTYGIGGWIIRSRTMNRARLGSGMSRFFEPLSLLPGVGRFCPDMIVVAQRI